MSLSHGWSCAANMHIRGHTNSIGLLVRLFREAASSVLDISANDLTPNLSCYGLASGPVPINFPLCVSKRTKILSEAFFLRFCDHLKDVFDWMFLLTNGNQIMTQQVDSDKIINVSTLLQGSGCNMV